MAEEVFDLGVEGAEVVGGPFFELFVELGVEAEEKGFTLGHGRREEC